MTLLNGRLVTPFGFEPTPTAVFLRRLGFGGSTLNPKPRGFSAWALGVVPGSEGL